MPKTAKIITLTQPTVKQFITALKMLPPNSKILQATDEEQNNIADKIMLREYKGEIVMLPLNPTDNI